jgi:hypothetical protein
MHDLFFGEAKKFCKWSANDENFPCSANDLKYGRFAGQINVFRSKNAKLLILLGVDGGRNRD